jgi:hypothetical protein
MKREEEQEPRTKEENGVSFAVFWGVYPRRVGRAKAEVAYKRALDRASGEEIVEGARRYADDTTRDPGYTLLPTTFLNQDRWTDDLVVSSPVQALGESEYLPMRFSDLPEGITFSEFLKNHATAEEREKAKRLGLKL